MKTMTTTTRRTFLGGVAAFGAFGAVADAAVESSWDPSVLAQGGETPLAPKFFFGPDGTFTFVHLTDIHHDPCGRKWDERSESFIRRAIAKAKPSLAILTGDQVNPNGKPEQSKIARGKFEEIADPIVALMRSVGVPFAITFGNHDCEHRGKEFFSRREQYEYYRMQGGRFFVDHDVPELDGSKCGIEWNFHAGSGVIGVCRPGETQSAFNLFVMDSGSYAAESYDGCRADQIGWYERVSGKTPCLWFQHIIVPDADDNGLFVKIPDGRKRVAYFREMDHILAPGVKGIMTENTHPTSRKVYYGDPNFRYEGRTLYESWIKMGNLKGAYFGHDHTNSWDGVDRNGIRMGMTKTCSATAYNDGDLALRVFKIRPDGTYDTELISERSLYES